MRTKKKSITIILTALLFVVVQTAVVLPGTALASDDVILDFGSAGTWVLYDCTEWSKLHSDTPESIATGDLDGNGQDEAIIDFGASGVWIRMNDSSWTKLHPSNPDAIVTGDMDGSGKDEAIVDFGKSGVWVRMNNASWTKLHPSNPETITTGDIDGNGLDEVIINFGASGVWIWQNNTSWKKLHSKSPDIISTGNMDGDAAGKDEVIIDFGVSGLWVWKNNTFWEKLHSQSVEIIETGDLDGNGKDDVVLDFGFGIGIWVRRNDTVWNKIHSLTPELIEVGDIDGTGTDDLIIDFGAPHGLWTRKLTNRFSFNDSARWNKLHNTSPEIMACGDMDGRNGIIRSCVNIPYCVNIAGLWYGIRHDDTSTPGCGCRQSLSDFYSTISQTGCEVTFTNFFNTGLSGPITLDGNEFLYAEQYYTPGGPVWGTWKITFSENGTVLSGRAWWTYLDWNWTGGIVSCLCWSTIRATLVP